MASNVTTSASFTTTNMKPAADEQIDALWGDNIADNTGYLLYREIAIPQISGSSPAWLFLFKKRSTHPYLRLMVRGDNTGSAAAVSDVINVYPEGQSSVAGTPSVTATHSYTRGVNTTSDYDIDVSSLTNDAVYIVKVTLDTAKTFHAPRLLMIYGNGATY